MGKVGRPIKSVIQLSPKERARLEETIYFGKCAVNSALEARILQKADVSENKPSW